LTAKEYLSQAFILDKRIQVKERRLEWLKNHASYVSNNLTEVVKASLSHRSAVEEAVVKIVDLEKELMNDINKMIELKKEIAFMIRSVNNIECETLLEMRYLTFMCWNDIMAHLNSSKDRVFRIHRKAINLINNSCNL